MDVRVKAILDVWQRPAVRRWLLVAFALAITFVVISGTRRALFGSSEFRGFRKIVQVDVVQSHNRYEHIKHVRAYPPFFSIFWAPWGVLPWGVSLAESSTAHGLPLGQQVQLGLSAFAVLALMAAMTVWSARCVARVCLPDPDARQRAAFTAALYVLTGGLMLNAVTRCETDMFVVMLLTGAMYLILLREKPWLGGALLGVAAAFKLTPTLFGIWLLGRRRWRETGAAIAAGLVCTILIPTIIWGPHGAYDRTRSWVTDILVPYATKGPEVFISRAYRDINQSPKAALVRHLTPYGVGGDGVFYRVNVADVPRPIVDRIAAGVKLAVLAALVAACFLPPVRTGGELEAATFALVPLGMLLLSDVSHGSHLAALVLPVGALLAYATGHEGRPGAGRAAIGLLAGAVLADLIAVKPLKVLSVGTAGILVLFVTLLCVVWALTSEQRRTAKAGEVRDAG